MNYMMLDDDVNLAVGSQTHHRRQLDPLVVRALAEDVLLQVDLRFSNRIAIADVLVVDVQVQIIIALLQVASKEKSISNAEVCTTLTR